MNLLNRIKLCFSPCNVKPLIRSYPSLSYSLRKIVGAKNFENIILSTPDRRHLVEQAAQLLGIGEEELIKKIAQKLEIPIYFRPKPTELRSLPPNVILPDLRRSGIVPIISNETVTGVVCIDPAELNLIPQLYAGSNIYLSSWKSILLALEESEQLHFEQEKALKEQEQESVISLCKQVLGRLSQQAQAVGCASLVLTSDLDQLLYSYRDASGREWSGYIDSRIALKLTTFLENTIAEDSEIIEAILDNDNRLELAIRVEHGRIVLDIPTASGIKKTEAENAKIMPFPRIVKQKEDSVRFGHSRAMGGQVLLIEDNCTFALVLEKYLSKQGLSTEVFSSVELALSRLENTNMNLPDVIISDLHMPGVGGVELIQKLKDNISLKHIPIIALTSDESQQTEVDILEAGADAFVIKSKDPRILCFHLKRLIELRRVA